MLLASVAAILIAPPMLVRRGQVELTPPEPLSLGGYTERRGKVMDPGGETLFARCVLLEAGNQKIAIVSAEMLTIPESLTREVKSRIPANVQLFLQATHTHCAPDSQMLNDRMTFAIPGIATFKRRWLEWYADQIASVVTKAASATPQETTSIFQTAYAVDANRARRQGGRPEKMSYWFEIDTRPSDPQAQFSRLFGFYTAHPTIYDDTRNQTSGDWIGEMAARRFEPILNGAIGDVSPAADGPTAEVKFSSFFSKFEAAARKRGLRRTVAWTAGEPLSVASQAIQLDPPRPHPAFAKSNGIPEPLAQSLVLKFAPRQSSILTIRFGSVALVGVPGEPTSVLGNQISAAGKKLGYKTILVCSHVNGWMGYILDPKDYDRGGYEAELSFYGRQEGNKVVAAAVASLKALR